MFEEPRVGIFQSLELRFDFFGNAIVDHLVGMGWRWCWSVGDTGNGGGG